MDQAGFESKRIQEHIAQVIRIHHIQDSKINTINTACQLSYNNLIGLGLGLDSKHISFSNTIYCPAGYEFGYFLINGICRN